ncbi:uncharacterized protein LOC111024360 [Momordica charantia]|uniref:Uncharacterized protein LOC111024360 n=1 Tax=Momordica charantia TaxID=3673 RepID=A0A6J1DV70_MOMCH|nr:uncharacterized protein LOC111024360 [Momordica charantia]
MAEQYNKRNQELGQDFERLKEQMTKILDLLMAQKGKLVVEEPHASDVVRGLDDTSLYAPGFTPQVHPHNGMTTIPGQPIFYTQTPPMVSFGEGAVQNQTFMVSEQVHPLVQQRKDINDLINNHELRNSGKVTEKAEKIASKGKLDFLEERLQAIEGADAFRSIDATQLCLMTDIVIPPKFKVLEFEKYDGTSCPRSHLIMYCKKMAAHVHEEKLLIHFIQDSLYGPASRWYMELDTAHVHKWKYRQIFLSSNTNTTWIWHQIVWISNDLENKSTENFKEYAQRWRDMAAQIQHPLTNKELTTMFINTLRSPYYDRMIGNASTDFSDIITIEERIEYGVKYGRIMDTTSDASKKKNFIPKKKEGEVHEIIYGKKPLAGNLKAIHYPVGGKPHRSYSKPLDARANTWDSNLSDVQRSYRNNSRCYDPIPLTYIELLPQLIWNWQFVPLTIDLCSHHTQNGTIIMRDAITTQGQWGIQQKAVTHSKGRRGPDVTQNPHPNHGNPTVNVIHASSEGKEVIDFVYQHLTDDCLNYSETTCLAWGNDVEAHFVNMVTEEEASSKYSFKLEPLVVIFKEQPTIISANSSILQPLTIQLPSPYKYKDNKAVPWHYGCHTLDEEVSIVTNISRVSGMTRSGICYKLETLKASQVDEQHKIWTVKGKEKDCPDLEEIWGEEPVMAKGSSFKKIVSDEEASEFLKLIKHNEYKVIEQLHHTPACISMLSIFINSKPHRKALMDVLNQSHVNYDITIEKLDGIVGNITSSNTITFMDEEIPPEGSGHTKALHTVVKCKDHAIAKVLVDNGSSLNVMPMYTLLKLPVDSTHIKHSSMVVRVFYGTHRGVVGDIELPIKIGPRTFNVTFQLMDISPTYSCLLGRPWIHSAGVIPSTLHQRLKFVFENTLICIFGQKDLLVTKSTDTPM